MPIDIAGNIFAAQQLVPRKSNILAQRQNLQNAQTQNALGQQNLRLREEQNNRLNAQEGRQSQLFKSDQDRQKGELMLRSAMTAQQNPAAIPSFVNLLKEMGEIDPSFQGNIGENELNIMINGLKAAGAGQMDSTSLPAGTREFQALTQTGNLSPEEQAAAARIALGMDPRAGTVTTVDVGGVPHYRTVVNGETVLMPYQNANVNTVAGNEATIAGTRQAAVEQAETEAIGPRSRAQRQAELEATAVPAYNAAQSAIQQAQIMVDTAKELREHPGLSAATGFGGETLSGIPGSPAADAAVIAQRLKAQQFARALADMRAASPTGGAVGQVSDAEGSRFENMYASLQQAQSYPQYVRQLDQLIEFVEGAQRRIRTAYESEYGPIETAPKWGAQQNTSSSQAGSQVPQISTDQEYDALPSGSQFLDPNGILRQKP